MRRLFPFLGSGLLAALPLAFSVQDDGPSNAAPDSVASCIVAAPSSVSETVTLDGVFVPGGAIELHYDPEAYAGGLRFVEVVAHGAYVNRGDVVARLEGAGLDDALEEARHALASAEIAHENALEKARIDEEEARERLTDARRSLERARRALKGWEEQELVFERRSDELSAQRTQHFIEDQEDELAQLEAMYRDDELVDATEEIVLERSRRSLAASRASQKLSQDRQKYEDSFETPDQTARKREDVEQKEAALDRLARGQKMAERSREDGLLQSKRGLDEKRGRVGEFESDREALMLRAPLEGVVLHGGLFDYGPGKVRPEHRPGASAAARTALFLVADPDRLAVAVGVKESQLDEVRSGAAARVTPRVGADVGEGVLGTLRLEKYPTPASGAAPEGAFAGMVELPRPMPGLVVGMRAEVEIVARELGDVLLLPRAAVFGAGADAHCWAAPIGGRDFRRTPLELGPARGAEVVVYGELAEGQRVLLAEPAE